MERTRRKPQLEAEPPKKVEISAGEFWDRAESVMCYLYDKICECQRQMEDLQGYLLKVRCEEEKGRIVHYFVEESGNLRITSAEKNPLGFVR